MFNMENQQGPAGQPRELCSILCNNFMVTRGKDGGRESQGVWDGHGHTAVFNMENQQGPAVQPRELCSMSRGSWDGRGVWRRMDACVCLSPLADPRKYHKTVSQLYPSTRQKVFKKQSPSHLRFSCILFHSPNAFPDNKEKKEVVRMSLGGEAHSTSQQHLFLC